ncbi:aldehyde dehydrogenase family protein [Rhodospirillaceae bacterium KN72]|uniref:Aldehyde dehydrogenase family protein n=2 Tax=Pacificispira spongiicola TaxID=2729598 RepID=A0A7Y0DXX2_9PROT|nr:aldehyde dehydrogenase family protein [Pacificispira spongiicola]
MDISASPVALKAKAELVLDRGRWASQVFQRYDRDRTMEIARHVAQVAHAKAKEYGEWAVKETGFGVAAHKALKNELSSIPLVDFYSDWNFVDPRLDERTGVVEIPKPAGVVFALAPSTNPIATIYFKVLASLMTRNAVVISPHPAALECCVDATKTLAAAAEEAGAPEGIVQVVEQVSLPLVDEFMKSPKTDVILATGGTPMVRAAYSSSNPAIGVGPGNAPVFVDATADVKDAARHIVDSKSFDNSVLCTNESVLITLSDVASKLERELSNAGAHLCREEEVEALRRYLFHARGFNVESLGRDAVWIADQAGFKVPKNTRILVAKISQIGAGEVLSKEKLCPVLGYFVASSVDQAIMQARALLRFSGAGHSAAIHSNDPQTVTDYAAAVESYRVVVNAPCSQGAAGFATNLSPSFTIGTGFFGRSSVGENIGPQHLVNWTRIAWHKDSGPLDRSAIGRLQHRGPLPVAPSDGVPGQGVGTPPIAPFRPQPSSRPGGSGGQDGLRDEIRQIIAEELRGLLKG